ncbi:MAG TPA: NnrS family protein [Rudaea sp.]|nr:NnrS family protein [Rudaea sp.]
MFGFTLAVVAGFLLTAVRNWTAQPTAEGAALAALAALWLAGRALVLTPFAVAAALVNAAFPLALAVAIGIPLLRAHNTRNYFFIGLLALLAALAAGLHLAMLGTADLPPRLMLVLGLDIVLFIMAVMGGRVIPMFTNNGVPGANAARHPLVEKFALGSVLLLFVVDALQAPPALVAAIALAATAAHGARLVLWRGWRTFGVPLVWILHAAYAWIVIHLALRCAAGLGWETGTLGTHALTAGAIGGLTIGMMTRTARGHTGRPLRADGWETAMFVLVQLAAAVRVFGGMVAGLQLRSIQWSALMWSVAFGLYAVRYWSVLTRARLDGKPG